MSHPSCLPVWIDVPDCTVLKADTAHPSPPPPPPDPLLSPAGCSLTQTDPTSHGPGSPSLAWLGSPQSNPTLLLLLAWPRHRHNAACPNTATLTGGRKRSRLNLRASRYTSPNCFFIKLTVIMKKPFLLPCFPSGAFLSPPPPFPPTPRLSP